MKSDTYSNLSLRAIGVLTIMSRSRAESGKDKLAFDAIQRLFSDSATAIKTALKELEGGNYICHKCMRDVYGHLKEGYYTVCKKHIR